MFISKVDGTIKESTIEETITTFTLVNDGHLMTMPKRVTFATSFIDFVFACNILFQ